MNGKEIIYNMIYGKDIDRVPIMPIVDGYHAPKVLGIPNYECFLDGNKMKKAVEECLRIYDYDGFVALPGPSENPEKALGCDIEVYGNDVPIFKTTLIKTKEDIEKIPIPSEFQEKKMSIVKELVEEYGDKKFIIGSVRLPFEYAAIMRGVAQAMEDMYGDPELLLEIIEKSKDITINNAKALIASGVHGIVFKDSVASGSLISNRHYKKFVFPYEKEVFKTFKKQTFTILHICRNSYPHIQDMVKTGAHALEIDSPVNLEDVFENIPENIIVKGNIEAVDTLERGQPKDIKIALEKAVNIGKKYKRLILSTGDSVTRRTSLDNMLYFIKTAKELGRI